MLQALHLLLTRTVFYDFGWERLGRGLGRRLERGDQGGEMATRIKTDYPGVYYYEQPRLGGPGTERVYYVVFKLAGKVHEEKAGR